jgi:cytochrome c-type biogenesis protein CcmH
VTTFWLASAAMVIAALASVLPALLGRGRRDTVERRAVNLAVHRDRLAEVDRQTDLGELGTEQVAQARREVEHDLLRDVQADPDAASPRDTRARRWTALLASAAVPLVAVPTYLALGTPEASRMIPASASPSAQAESHGAAPIDELVQGLARRLQAQPDDLKSWVLLGRAYLTLERYAEASRAFEAASGLAPEDPAVLTHLAEASALASGGDLSGRPEALVLAALQVRPDYPDALWLAGLSASQGGRYPEAIERWETLLAATADPEARALLAQYIGAARKQASGLDPGPSAAAAGVPAAPGLSVRVSISPDLAAHAAGTDTVFVFARPSQGSRMPLALVRTTVDRLPATLTLDDSTAMNPDLKLSSVPEIVVGARVSKSGQAMPQAGDLEGLSAALSPVSVSSVSVTVDRRL